MTQIDWLREGLDSTADGFASSATRTARVWDPNPVTALEADGLPAVGDAHPDNQFLVRMSMQATREPAIEACIVQVNYGVIPFAGGDGGSNEIPFDTSNVVGRMSQAITTTFQEFKTPVLRPNWVRPVNLVPGDLTPSQLAWAAEDGALLAITIQNTVRTSFRMTPTQNVAAVLNAFWNIVNQTGKLHIVGGRPYLFHCRLLNQATEGNEEEGSDLWNAEYTWTYDPGVPLPEPLPSGWVVNDFASNAGSFDIKIPALPSALVPGQRFVKPPWADVFHGPLSLENQSLTEPTFFSRQLYEVDTEGHLLLPGVTT